MLSEILHLFWSKIAAINPIYIAFVLNVKKCIIENNSQQQAKSRRVGLTLYLLTDLTNFGPALT